MVEFSVNAYADIPAEQKSSLVRKLKNLTIEDTDDEKTNLAIDEIKASLTAGESRILDVLRSRRMLRHKDAVRIDNFKLGCIDGLAPNLERGKLGLIKATPVKVRPAQLFSLNFFKAEKPNIRK